MPLLSDAELRRVMHSYGYTKSGAARKPKAQRRKYAGAAARAPTAKNALALRKVAGEKKGVDTVLTVAAVLATTTTAVDIIPVNLIVAGSGSMNRVGRKIFNKSLRVSGSWTHAMAPTTGAGTDNITGNVLRMIVVWDKQPSGVLPVFADIFAGTPQSGTDASTVLSLPRYDNMSRFQVLRDCKYASNPQLITDTGTTNVAYYRGYFDEYIKLGNRQTIYGADSSPAVIGDISSGGLYVIFRSVNSVGSPENTFAIDATSIARLRYSD